MPNVLSKPPKVEEQEQHESEENTYSEEISHEVDEESQEEMDKESDAEEVEDEVEEDEDESKIKEKIVVCYNRYLKVFIKKFKENNDEVIKILKRHKRIEYNTLEYIHCFDIDQFSEQLNKINLNKIDDLDILTNKEFGDLMVYYELKLKYIIDKLSNDYDKLYFMKLIMIFNILKYLLQQEEDDYIEELFEKMILVLNEHQIKNINKYIDDIVDDDIIDMIKQMIKINAYIDYENKKNTKTESPDEFMKGIEKTQIGKLAKEISNDINLDDFNINKPEDLLKNMTQQFSGNQEGGPNLFQSLFEKIGSKITNKVESGELKHDELLADAFGMMNQLNGENNNPLSGMMNQMMKNMGAMKGQSKGNMMNKIKKEQQKQQARERLSRRKTQTEEK